MERVEDQDDRINCIECRNSCKCPVARLRCGRFRPITGVEPPWLERMRRREIVEIAHALGGAERYQLLRLGCDPQKLDADIKALAKAGRVVVVRGVVRVRSDA